LSAKEAASERGRQGVRMVGVSMPTRLIQPKRGEGQSKANEGKVAWGVDASGAVKSKRDGSGVTVAVLDTGIEADHTAFVGVDLIRSDFTDNAGTAADAEGHGTHCAGTAFGRDVDGIRIGVAPGVTRALIGKVLADDGGGDSTMLFDALNWASKEGANIVSMSLGFDFPGMIKRLIDEQGLPADLAASTALVAFSQNLRAFDALLATYRSAEAWGRNMLVVAAAGNESEREHGYRISTSLPAAAVGVVSVAAYGQEAGGFGIASFSNCDAQISGPGVDIVSAGLGGGLAEMSGTSQATPHIAGLAALWWQELKELGEIPTPDRVREKMFANATIEEFVKGVDEADRGRGRAHAP
jgi:subtilisin family serine protease